MNNKDVLTWIISNYSLDVSEAQSPWYADQFHARGFGQTNGEYGSVAQIAHFVSYYQNERRQEQKPSYNQLLCPELMLFVAELAGAPRRVLTQAADIISAYEQAFCLVDAGNAEQAEYSKAPTKLLGLDSQGRKKGSYLLSNAVSTLVFYAFKQCLHIHAINAAFRQAHDMVELHLMLEEHVWDQDSLHANCLKLLQSGSSYDALVLSIATELLCESSCFADIMSPTSKQSYVSKKLLPYLESSAEGRVLAHDIASHLAA